MPRLSLRIQCKHVHLHFIEIKKKIVECIIIYQHEVPMTGPP